MKYFKSMAILERKKLTSGLKNSHLVQGEKGYLDLAVFGALL